MRRCRPAILSLLVRFVVLAAGPACLHGQDQPVPSPTRIHYFGNSLTDELKYDHFKALATDQGHPVDWKREMAPGVPVFHHWSRLENWRKKLTEEHWDVVTLQPFQNFEREYQACESFAAFLADKQPDVQLYIYGQWPHRQTADWFRDFTFPSELAPTERWSWTRNSREKTGEAYWLETVAAAAREAGYPARIERSLKNQYELTVQGLRSRVPMNKPVKLIPVGHAIELLGHKMRAGLVPGFTRPHELYSDGVHVSNVGSYIVACTFYASIFQTSPVGLPVAGYQGDPEMWRGSMNGSDDNIISDELARVIQETVWEVVATHPLTGVRSEEPPRVATPGLHHGVAGAPYRAELMPAFGVVPHRWDLPAGGLPDGLALREDGVLSGKTDAVGTRRFPVRVTDAEGHLATRELELVIEDDRTPRIVTPARLLPRKVGEYISLQLESEGGNGAVKWQMQDRNSKMPPGLSMSFDGRVQGAPGAEGTYEIKVKATDADPADAETVMQTFVLEVGSPSDDVRIVRYVPRAPKVDGRLDEAFWNPDTVISKTVVGTAGEQTAHFDAVWNGGTIYVGVRVIDPSLHVNPTSLREGDSVELFIDGKNNREDTFNRDDLWIVVAPITTWYAKMYSAPRTWGMSYECVPTDDGFTAEFGIRVGGVGVKRGTEFPIVMGLDIAVNDERDGNGRDSQIVWQGTAENHIHPDRYGTVVLEAEQPVKE